MVTYGLMNLALLHAENVGKAMDQLNLQIYATNIQVEFPFAPEGHTKHLDGRESMARFLNAIGEFTEAHRIESMSITQTEAGFLLQYTEFSIFKSTRNEYSSDILWVAKVENGLITHLSEYYNPISVLTALNDY